jgi:uncharacterized membrane protein
MQNPIVQQYIAGAGCILLGLCGWLLPYRWNVLRLRRHLARLVSEKINRLIPKVVGTALIIIGLIVVIVTIVVGKMD